MRSEKNHGKSRYFTPAAFFAIALSAGLAGHRFSAPRTTFAIVQCASAAEAEALVKSVGGTVSHDLAIIDAVAAPLTHSQLKAVRARGARTYGDAKVEVAGTPYPNSAYPTLIGAATLHQQGITGAGVTVAVMDTSWWGASNPLKNDTKGKRRDLANTTP